jgi:hypothetical protein
MRYEARGKIDYKEIAGHPPTVATPKDKEKISNAYEKKCKPFDSLGGGKS